VYIGLCLNYKVSYSTVSSMKVYIGLCLNYKVSYSIVTDDIIHTHLWVSMLYYYL